MLAPSQRKVSTHVLLATPLLFFLLPAAVGSTSCSAGNTLAYAGSASPALSSADTIVNNTGTNGSLGASVSIQGDVNGDGVSDLVLAASELPLSGVFVIFGPDLPASIGLPTYSLDGSNGFKIEAPSGWGGPKHVSSAGDVNSDGVNDILVGYANGGVNNHGGAAVVFGKRQGDSFPALVNVDQLDGTDGFVLSDNSGVLTYLGTSVAMGGDVNGDSVDDTLIASPSFNGNQGIVYAMFGKPQGQNFSAHVNTSSLNGTHDGFVIYGVEADARFGWSLAMGDVTGDGLSDILVSAPDAEVAGNDVGKVYVLFGRPDGNFSDTSLSGLDGSTGFVIAGITEANAMGTGGNHLSVGKSVNGDGIDDILIGFSNLSLGNGSAYVVFGKPQTENFTAEVSLPELDGTDGFLITGESGGRFGLSVSLGSDIDNDGVGDLVIGSQEVSVARGRVYVIFGSELGFSATVSASSLADGERGFTVDGTTDSHRWSQVVASGGDLNNDTIGDFVFVGRLQDGSNPGEVAVMFGQGSTCNPCEAGKFKADTSSLPCTECEAGKYSAVGSQACSLCPQNAGSLPRSSSVVNCSCLSGYTGPDGGNCTACPAGTYKSFAGGSNCTLCPAGTYSHVVASKNVSSCLLCPGNSSSVAGSVNLTDCLCNPGYGGTYGEDCSACRAGTYKDQGTQNCTACPARSQSLPASNELSDCLCNPGYSGPDGGICLACPPGKYKNELGSSNCTTCPNNTVSQSAFALCLCLYGFTGPNGGPCRECSAGTYKNFTGPANCTQCPEFATSVPGSSLIVNCTCQEGFVGDNGGICSSCTPGTYKDLVGSSPCVDCEAGKFSTTPSASNESLCQDCPFASYSPSASGNITSCVCNVGYTGPGGGPCSGCPKGKYKVLAGSSQCLDCLGNSYSGGESAACQCNKGYSGPDGTGTACSACLSGLYKDVEGSSPCSTCPLASDSVAASTHIENCTCNLGYTGPNGMACSHCPAGTFKDLQGSSPCSSCPLYSYSNNASTSQTECKCNGGYTGPDGTACNACESGKFKPLPGPQSCTTCAPDSSSAEAALICVCNVGHTGPDGGTCVACSPGTYKDITGASNCSDCPPDTISPEGSSNQLNCSCNAGYTGIDGGPCAECEDGKYKAILGSSQCQNCSITRCPNVGTFRSTCHPWQDGACVNCTKKPEGSDFISAGLPYDRDNCAFECRSGSILGFPSSSDGSCEAACVPR